MSSGYVYFVWQSRNARFAPELSGVHVNLRVPVKRRRALVANGPDGHRPKCVMCEVNSFVSRMRLGNETFDFHISKHVFLGKHPDFR